MGTTPEAHLERLADELDACFAGFLALPAPPDLAALDALALAFRERSRSLPPATETAHVDWLRRKSGWYKLVLGPDGRARAPALPPGTPSAPLALVPRLFDQICELRYALYRRDHPSPCDCAAQRACARFREPRSPALRPLGRSSDGYYLGDAFECGSCGARWFRGIGDDDHGTLFWQPDES